MEQCVCTISVPVATAVIPAAISAEHLGWWRCGYAAHPAVGILALMQNWPSKG